jgi:hypothetical protein
MAVPKTRLDDISDLINAELHQPKSTDLSIRRLEREVAAIKGAPDAEVRNQGLVLSAVIEALRFDVDATRQRFEQALAATGYHSNVYVNYAVALTALGLFRDAFEKIELAVQKAPEIDTLRLAGQFAGHVFDVEKVKHYAEWLNRLNALDDHAGLRKALDGMEWQAAVVQAPGVDRNRLLDRYEAARGIARQHKLRIPDERATLSIRGVLVEWAAYCEADEVAVMNYDAAAVMAEIPADPSELIVSFGYAQSSSFAKQAA